MALPPLTLKPWPLFGRETPRSILPLTFAARREGVPLALPPPTLVPWPAAADRGEGVPTARPVASVPERDPAIDPPLDILGAAVVQGEDVPLAPPSADPRPVAFVQSGEGGSPRSILPQSFVARRSTGERVSLQHPSRQPLARCLCLGDSPPAILPPIFAARRSTKERLCLRHSPCRPSSRGLCPGERRRDRSSPQCSWRDG